MKTPAVPISASPATPDLGEVLQRTDIYRIYVIAILWLMMLVRFVDLQIVSVLLESIKKEFAVSDTALGLMSGLGFAIFYGTLGIPIAWLADRYNRRNIIAASVGLWSIMTGLCGVAGSFTTLFLSRIGVGVGEAGGSAPAYSYVADYVRPSRRSTVFAILNSSVPAGVFVGFLIGGYVNAHYGWRAAFMSVGVPGVLLALLIRFTLSEPARGMSEARSVPSRPEPVRKSIGHLLRVPAFVHLVIGSTTFTMGAMGSGAWAASFFTRVHALPASTVAVTLGFIYGGGGVLGSLAGGFLADRMVLRTGDQRWHTWISGGVAAAIVPFAFCVYLDPNPTHAFLAQAAIAVLMHAWMGSVYGTIQSLAGIRRRAVAAALNMLAINLVAYALGALLVGAASDFLSTWLGVKSLGYAILIVVVLSYSWAAAHFFLAGRTLRVDLRNAEADID